MRPFCGDDASDSIKPNSSCLFSTLRVVIPLPPGSNRRSVTDDATQPRRLDEKGRFYPQDRTGNAGLAKRLIAFEPTSFSKSIDDAQRRFHALALCIVDDSRSIATSMHAGRNSTRGGTGEFGRLCE